MTNEQVEALKNFIYWSCCNAAAEATGNSQGEYRRLQEAEKEFDAAIAQLVQPTSAEYAQGYAEGFNDACKPAEQPAAAEVLREFLDAFDGVIAQGGHSVSIDEDSSGWVSRARAAVAHPVSPPFGDKRKAAMAVYIPPFNFHHGYIFDSQNLMVADNGGINDKQSVDGAVAARVRGWGRLGYLPNGAELQDEIGQMMTDALNALYANIAQSAQPAVNEWKTAVLDALACTHMDAFQDQSPGDILEAVINWNVSMAIIPQRVQPALELEQYIARNYPDAKGGDLSEQVIDALETMDIALGVKAIAQPAPKETS